MNKKQSIITLIICLIFVIGITPIIVYAHFQDGAIFNKSILDTAAEQFIKENPVKAMIYGLWVNGQPISVNAIGDSMTQVPVEANMHVRIGGVTETMLTTMLMQLVDNKLVSLHTPIAKWFPELPNSHKVTLHMLANSTSGYPDYVYNEKFVDKVISDPFKHWTSKELIAYAMENNPLFEPGESQHYSHTDYVILGEIISKVRKQPIDKAFKQMIFKKIGMIHSAFNLTAEMPFPVLHAFSQDREIYEDATFWDPSWTSTSGAVSATIDDLGKWGQEFMEGSLLTKASTETLRAPDTVGKGKNTANLYFAMGFGVANHWMVQNPRFGGYSGIFAILPEKNIIFVAYNTEKKAANNGKNLSKLFWQKIASILAPDYLPPKF